MPLDGVPLSEMDPFGPGASVPGPFQNSRALPARSAPRGPVLAGHTSASMYHPQGYDPGNGMMTNDGRAQGPQGMVSDAYGRPYTQGQELPFGYNPQGGFQGQVGPPLMEGVRPDPVSPAGLHLPMFAQDPALYDPEAYGVNWENPDTHAVRFNERVYERYAHSQSQWAFQVSEDLEFVYNGHWTEEQRKVLEERRQAPICIPATFQTVSQAVAMLTANNPRFQAVARDDSDTKDSFVANSVLEWIWQQSKGQLRHKRVTFDSYVMGRGVFHVGIDPNGDYGKGEVILGDFDPRSVFPDPASTDVLWDDAEHVILHRLVTRSQLQKLAPGVDLSRAFPTARDYAGGYGPTGRSFTRGQQIHPQNINYGDADDPYAVIVRQTKVKRNRWRITDPMTGRDEIMTEEEFQERLSEPAYIVTTNGVAQAILTEEGVQEAEAMFDAYGPMSHMIELPPEVVDDGMGNIDLQPVPPVRVPGSPEESEAQGIPVIEGSAIHIEPLTVGHMVQLGVIEAVPFVMDYIQVTESAGGVLLYQPYDLPTGNYTLVPFNSNHTRNTYPISDVRLVKDLQEDINKTHSLILAWQANATNQKVFLPEGSTDFKKIERDWGKAGAAFFTYRPDMGYGAPGTNGGIVVVQPTALPNHLFIKMDKSIQLMERTMGVFSMQQGDPSQAPATYNGTLALDEYATRRIKSKLDDHYAALCRVGQVALDLAQQVYTYHKTVRIVQPGGGTEQLEMNKQIHDDYGVPIKKLGDLGSMRYDVHVVSGSTLPTNRWALLEQYMRLYQMQLVDQEAVLRRAEIPDADKILERSSIMAQMQQQIASLEDENKRLSGQLQTTTREAINARKREEVTKFRADLDDVARDARSAEAMFEARLRDSLSQIQQMAAVQARQNNR